MTCGIGRKMIAEILAAFIVVFFGLGSVFVSVLSFEQPLSSLGEWLAVGFVFGLFALAAIYVFGKISGCHLSPGVTLGLWLIKQINGKNSILYIIAQLIGSIIATGALFAILPEPTQAAAFAAPNPTIGLGSTFVAELIGSFALMLIIMGVAVDSKAQPGIAGISVGLTVTGLIVFLGPITNAGITPIRYFGSYVFALIYGSKLVAPAIELLILYLFASILGSLIATGLYVRLAKGTDVCELPSPYQD